ncbi:sulfur carrier protein ThiS [Pseudomarimonas arenosa]|uniref:Sulfur carrier protein ThiS n=1 Tax=Pseudomarimonas arenosa TaxID=2774145 RepID=A0AAW3ZDX4_9GAMM|nr:sulfur carrier protein ThiS [Pseudomarimonas arenosa]MBD8524228.1 sulfur carrier protein ThiS [Pseudomarimonas arenosa]
MNQALLTILVNGQPHRLPTPISVAELLVQLGHEQKRVAVELNREIVPKSRHAEQQLADGDQLELVHAMGGG